MKTLKKLVALLAMGCLFVFAFVGCGGPKAYVPTNESVFEYALLEDGTYSIALKEEYLSVPLEMLSIIGETISIPKEHEGKAVTAISENGFRGLNASEVRIPSSIKVVGKNAFYGSTISSVYFYKGVEKICDGAFHSCKNITSLTLPSSLQEIGASAFFGISIRDLKLPEKVKTVGAYAFAYCADLSSVYISHSVSSIGESAFTGCSEKLVFEISASNTYFKLDENGFPVAK